MSEFGKEGTLESEVKLAASMVAADQGRLLDEAKRAEQAGAEVLHFDIMDGHFIPNLSFGPALVKSIRAHVRLPFHVHLMVTNPEQFIKPFSDSGANLIYVHPETSYHIHRILKFIKSSGSRAGLALNPGTPLSQIGEALHETDSLLILTNNDSTFVDTYQDQQFIAEMTQKIRQAKSLIQERNLMILVGADGGINDRVACDVVSAGCGLLVAGSAIFGQRDLEAAIRSLRKAALEGLKSRTSK